MVRQCVGHDCPSVRAMTEDATLHQIVASTQGVLLDFDGPMTPLMPAPLNFEIADSIRSVLRNAEVPMPADVEDTKDPLVVLRFAANLAEDVEAVAEQTCRDAEVEAARRASPTPGALELLAACAATDRPLVIVTNNSADAAWAFVQQAGLVRYIADVCGRPAGHPELMKPDPYLLHSAIEQLGLPAQDCVLFGDSVSDVVAAARASVRCVGFGKHPQRAKELADAGADVVVETVLELARVIGSTPKRS